MSLNNTWVGFYDRTFEQMKESILTRLGIVAPELSDHTESNPFIIILDIFMGISELLHYYVDNVAREVFLHSARQYASGQKIAKLFNYRLKGYAAASVTLKFFVEEALAYDVTIPVGTIALAEEIKYTTVNSVILLAGSLQVESEAYQVYSSTLDYTSTGETTQKILLEYNTVDESVSVAVNGVQYAFQRDLYLSTTTDNHFTTEIGADKGFYVVFGDGVNGVIPTLGATITFDFYTTDGEAGNVAIGEISTLESTLDSSVKVTNEDYATGGYDLETLEDLKKAIPASFRTLNRAVTELDFKDIAETVTGVAQAYPVYDCGASVDVYIVPTGSGEATSVLTQSVKDAFYDETRLILMDVEVLSAGRVSILLDIDVAVLAVYNKESVTTAVTNTLLEFLSPTSQLVSGNVRLGDIYQQIENTEGVDFAEVNLLSLVPVATKITGNSTLDWTRSLTVSSTTLTAWTITVTGTNLFALRKGSTLVGNYNFGVAINLTDIIFTVNDDGYTVGDSWSFNTYKYSGSISLDEPSIATLSTDNLTLNVTGGV